MTSIIRISLNVANLARSQKFFTDLLGFRKSRVPAFAPPSAQSCVMALGDQAVELVEHHPHGAPYPPGSTACDLWFQHFAIVTADMPATYARLQKAGATPISNGGPQMLPPEAGNVIAYKFRDPDGHPLELLQFPSNNTVRIDHSAISVSDAERSIAFYRLARPPTNRAPDQHRPCARPPRRAFERHGRRCRARSTRRNTAPSGASLLQAPARTERWPARPARHRGRDARLRRRRPTEARGCPQSGGLFHRNRRSIRLHPRSRRAWRRIGRTVKPSRAPGISTSGVLQGPSRHV